MRPQWSPEHDVCAAGGGYIARFPSEGLWVLETETRDQLGLLKLRLFVSFVVEGERDPEFRWARCDGRGGVLLLRADKEKEEEEEEEEEEGRDRV